MYLETRKHHIIMKTRSGSIFSTIISEGGLLPTDLLQRISEGDNDLDGLRPETYHLLAGERLNEAINRSWNRLLGAWQTFKRHLETLPQEQTGTGITRERWLLPLFQELGFGRLQSNKGLEFEGKSYPISHMWNHSPVHLVGCRLDLDRRTAGAAGAARSSPHSLVQEFLNRSDDHLWAFLANGLTLRILRDNVSLTRQAYVEFDLQAMLEGEVYADFAVLWLVCHQSRVEDEIPEECWLERWSKQAQKQGTRALDTLRSGVEKAIVALGQGFLAQPGKLTLKEKLRQGELDKQDFYRQILRLIYRLIFLFVAEDRNLLLLPDADAATRKRYLDHYSTARLRQLAAKQSGSRHVDLGRMLMVLFSQLSSSQGCPALGLPALGSFLWHSKSISDLNSADIANRDLLAAIRHLSFTVDNGIRRPVDYKNLGSEELGSIYESLLELHPDLNLDNGAFTLDIAAGHERKATGSYYTPAALIQGLLDSALDPVLKEALAAPDPETAILNLKVCDPACGSGHFLVAAAHRLARSLATARTGDLEAAPLAVRKALRDVIGHCIYGVDINPMSVELCKVNLWMEAMEPGKPLTFLDHHIQCGNSLLGSTPALLKKGLPDKAFDPIEGDDQEICRDLKRRNRSESGGQQRLWDREGTPACQTHHWLTEEFTELQTVDNSDFDSITAQEELYHELMASREYQADHLLADAWCAVFVWEKVTRPDHPLPPTNSEFSQWLANPAAISPVLQQEIRKIADNYNFFHFHLAFPEVFPMSQNDEDKNINETTGWRGGFDVVLGNPPWERIKLQEKEWFAERRPDIASAPNAARRRSLIAALEKEDPALYQAFLDDRRQAEGASSLVRNGGLYPFCGRGDINTYTIFAELKRSLIAPCGRVGCIVPSGIATDDTTKFFFQDLMDSQSLVSLFDFENRKKIFPGIDSRIKFCLLTMTGSGRPATEGAEFIFFALNPLELRDPERRFRLSAEDIALINPNTRTCPIFRNQRDAEITRAIYRRVPVMIDETRPDGNPWGLSFLRMLDMANDSGLFKTGAELEEKGFTLDGNRYRHGSETFLPLYEAKMVHHYNHRFGDYQDLPAGSRSTQLPEVPKDRLNDPTYAVQSRYWVAASEVDARLRERWPHNWLMGWRRNSRNNDERTFIATSFPLSSVGDSLFLFQTTDDRIINLSSLFSSIIFDYVTRQKIGGTNNSFFIVKQLPILPPSIYTDLAPWDTVTLADWLLPRILELTYTSHDLKPFARDCGFDGPPFGWDEERRFLLRCELDAAYFHLYGIERDDVDYILETFPIVKRKDVQRHGEYRTKTTILEIYDAMTAAHQSGTHYQTRLNPPPADPSCAHSETARIE